MKFRIWHILALFLSVANACHDERPPDIKRLKFSAAGPKSTRKSAGPPEWTPLTIKAFYSDTEEQSKTPQVKYVKEVIFPKLFKYFEDMLDVRKNEHGKMWIGRQCVNTTLGADFGFGMCYGGCAPTDQEKCGSELIPEDHLLPCMICEEGVPCHNVEASAGAGVDAHFLLYVSFKADDVENTCVDMMNHIAASEVCRVGIESEFNRPLAAHINICPMHVGMLFNARMLEMTLRHEIIHALGFSHLLYPFFRDEKGEPRSKRGANGYPETYTAPSGTEWYKVDETTLKMITRDDWWTANGEMKREMVMLVTPKATLEARNHFSCEELEGVEMEDQNAMGGPAVGVVGGHLEKRVYAEEAMSAVRTVAEPIVSRITLGILEDSGWYKVSYGMAGELNWGKDRGCEFAMKSCGYYMNQHKDRVAQRWAPYCTRWADGTMVTTPPKPGLFRVCNEKHTARTNCGILEYSDPLPDIYQNFKEMPDVKNFDSKTFGGDIPQADYCPIPSVFLTWDGARDPYALTNSICGLRWIAAPEVPGFEIEERNKQITCVETTDQYEKSCDSKDDGFMAEEHASCMKYECDNDAGHLLLYVDKTTKYTCYSDGQLIRFDRKLEKPGGILKGSAVCPPCELFCSNCKEDGGADVDLTNIGNPPLTLDCSGKQHRLGHNASPEASKPDSSNIHIYFIPQSYSGFIPILLVLLIVMILYRAYSNRTGAIELPKPKSSGFSLA